MLPELFSGRVAGMRRFLFVLLFSLSSSVTFANTTAEATKAFLLAVAQNSLDFQIAELDKKTELMSSDIDLAEFDFTGSLSAEITDSEDPATSPFSSDSTRRMTYSTGVSKLSQSGIETSLGYTLVDNLTTFPSRDDSDFLSPDLSITLSTSVFKDLVEKRKRQVQPRIDREKEAISLKSKVKKKAILVQALLALSELLEVSNELELQRKFCVQISDQAKKLKQKRARRSVPERDYLLSVKEFNSCAASVKSLEKTLSERKENLQVKYGVGSEVYGAIKVEEFFVEFSQLFSLPEYSKDRVKISDRSELLALRKDLDVLKLQGKELKAETRPELNVELTAGLQGLQSGLGDAHEDLSQANFPYILGSVSLEFPFSNRQAKINKKVNDFKIEVTEKEIEKSEKESTSRFTLLHSGLLRDLSIYKHYTENVSLSQKVLKEARRDFDNGRIDFFTLSEFQKGLITSRRQLASLRTQIIIQTVEYLDYFQFFDRYF